MSTAPLRLTRAQARRLAVRAQLLDGERPTDLLAVTGHLTYLPMDPTAAVAPSVDLVPWSRMGRAHWVGAAADALADRMLFQLQGTARSTDDLPLYLAEMAHRAEHDWRGGWVRDNATFRDDVLELLGEQGPLTSREVPDTSVRPWQSSGWTGHRNVSQMLELLCLYGDVAVAGRRGREKLWDLAERVYPDVEPVPYAESLAERAARRLHALGLSRARIPGVPGDADYVTMTGVEVEVEGAEGVWQADPQALDGLGAPFEPRTAILSPFDGLVTDRERLLQVFDFEYLLEMYKPAAKRRWGYFALPVLHGEAFVGKVDAKVDRRAGVLHVHAIHEDVPFAPEVTDAVTQELDLLARWLGLAEATV
ncbi:winged helix DNA-binding domain-containing protein [Isoptericola sp. NEAU-Y5]|uniref:Winged helix DNA-binding domain-containing protein n=1 Tax=Isoptericola luteus TaxID=2879484 RepID=A0ABS7ZCE0_9MICO|nr:crosslink repair DNA glycosylase YcaQ family protein [Isoptericola sp. NEAU-Y5]MCA5892697.1 winged helix DNA-binding domain-containing protein [Isoptericola sp. NEAU-Y5]